MFSSNNCDQFAGCYFSQVSILVKRLNVFQSPEAGLEQVVGGLNLGVSGDVGLGEHQSPHWGHNDIGQREVLRFQGSDTDVCYPHSPGILCAHYLRHYLFHIKSARKHVIKILIDNDDSRNKVGRRPLVPNHHHLDILTQCSIDSLKAHGSFGIY